jgi:hypothetical protein
MSTALTITETGAQVAPSIIGFRLADDRVVGFRELGKITWKGLLKTGIATGIAGAATAVRGANVALAEIEYSRSQMQTHLAKMRAQRDDAVNRAAVAEAKISRKVQRWSPTEKAYLAEFFTGPAKHQPYAQIADAMVAEFSRPFTAASVGAQARKLGLVTKAAPKPAKPVSKPRTRRNG